MPLGFTNCVRRGGKVRTKKLGGKQYMRICYIDGKSFAGEKRTKKENPSE